MFDYSEAKSVSQVRRINGALPRQERPPISVRCVDVSKGDDEHIITGAVSWLGRSGRRVSPPIFAPTSPLESIRAVFGVVAAGIRREPCRIRDGNHPDRTQVSAIDISNLYSCATADQERRTYFSLPSEHGDYGQDKCALLLKHMYGTKVAADGWHCGRASLLTGELGVSVGLSSPCTFWHHGKKIYVLSLRW